MRIHRAPCLAVVLVGLEVFSRVAAAQGVRITGVTTMDYEELQPMAVDSVPASTTTPDTGLLRQMPNGTIVECTGVDAYCSYYRSTSRINTVPILQDLTATGWGLGQGISIYADAEIRTAVGSDVDILPLASEHFDLIAAYAELDRSIVRIRLGRQWANSPLGSYAYDGGSALVAPLRGLTAQLYGGWGLAQGLTYERTNPLIPRSRGPRPDRSRLHPRRERGLPPKPPRGRQPAVPARDRDQLQWPVFRAGGRRRRCPPRSDIAGRASHLRPLDG